MNRPTDRPDALDMDVIYYLIGKTNMYGLQGVDADNSAPFFSVALDTAASYMESATDDPNVRQQACKATAEAILAISIAGCYGDEVNHPASG